MTTKNRDDDFMLLKHEREQRPSSKSNASVLFNRYVWLVDTIYPRRAHLVRGDQRTVDAFVTRRHGRGTAGQDIHYYMGEKRNIEIYLL